MMNLFGNGLTDPNAPKGLNPIKMQGADVLVDNAFLTQDEASTLIAQLVAETQWQQHDVVVHGNTYKQPRLVAWHGDAGSYSYSGLTLQPEPMTPLLKKLQARIEAATGADFNSVLINRYVAGHAHGIGHHSDNEKELGTDPTIAMLTLGEGRALEFQPLPWRVRELPEASNTNVPTPPGSLLVMRGKTQRNWKHGVTKRKGQTDRVTLTFRKIYN